MNKIPLYFLPGTQCDEQLWQAVFSLLPEHFEHHAIVLPQGESPHAIVQKLHLQLPHSDVNLVGFSLGGYLSALYAATYPDQCNKLLVLANAPHALPDDELITREQTLDYLSRHKYGGMPIKRIHHLMSHTNHNNTSIINTISAMDKRGGKAMLIDQLASTSRRINLLPALKSLPITIKFVIGSDDNLVDIATLRHELTSSRIPLDIIEDCGHMSPLESPQAVATHLINFFS